MNTKLSDALRKDFPLLFSSVGFNCGDGWEFIIRQAAEKLEPLIKEWMQTHPEEKDFAPTASQIKEKYGTLRFYLSTGTTEMYAIVDEVERVSEKTCETCGQPGKTKGKGWIYTACNEHTKPKDKVIDFNNDLGRILKN